MYPIHRSTVTFFLWLAFLAGVAHIPQFFLFLGSCAAAALAHGWRRWLLLPSLIAIGLIGQWRYDSHQPVQPWQPDEELSATGTVRTPPVLHDGEQRLVIEIDGNRLQVDTATYPAYQYGDVVGVRCRIRVPEPIEDFAYDKYLARYHIVALCDDSQIDLLSHTDTWLGTIYRFRVGLRQRVERLWSEPAASLLLGVLIGEQDTISPSIYESFRRAGVVHILVVSGMHVLIIIQLLTAVTKWLPRFYQTVIIFSLLAGFCVLTGLSATVIRATVMGSVPVLGRLFGRPSSIHLALTWAAGIMTVVNPYILVHDVGFQLSFLATLGLVYATPWVKPLTSWLPERFLIRETVTTSVAAMVTTAPWIAYIFGTWSNVAILANLVVVPISNIMLLVGAILVLFPIDTLVAMLGSVIALMVHYVEWCASLPYAYVSLW